MEFAYSNGYDSHSRVSVNHIVDEWGCSPHLEKPYAAWEGSGEVLGED